MTPITEDGLLDIGFEHCRMNGELRSGHIYDFQVVCKDFEVKRYRVREDDRFVVVFRNYYEENEFYGFEYIEQIQRLIEALYP